MLQLAPVPVAAGIRAGGHRQHVLPPQGVHGDAACHPGGAVPGQPGDLL